MLTEAVQVLPDCLVTGPRTGSNYTLYYCTLYILFLGTFNGIQKYYVETHNTILSTITYENKT